MILALDVLYNEAADNAVAAGVIFSHWSAGKATDTIRRVFEGIAPYEPGQFYRRELPCLLPLVEVALKTNRLRTVVVDGFVDLGDRGAGLGRHLHRVYQNAFEVVGIAKSPFVGSPGVAVKRGGSKRPLWVTATGDVDTAAENVRCMAGDSRIPTLLRLVDRMTRSRG